MWHCWLRLRLAVSLWGAGIHILFTTKSVFICDIRLNVTMHSIPYDMWVRSARELGYTVSDLPTKIYRIMVSVDLKYVECSMPYHTLRNGSLHTVRSEWLASRHARDRRQSYIKSQRNSFSASQGQTSCCSGQGAIVWTEYSHLFQRYVYILAYFKKMSRLIKSPACLSVSVRLRVSH
jgi:hypothetical protein